MQGLQIEIWTAHRMTIYKWSIPKFKGCWVQIYRDLCESLFNIDLAFMQDLLMYSACKLRFDLHIEWQFISGPYSEVLRLLGSDI